MRTRQTGAIATIPMYIGTVVACMATGASAAVVLVDLVPRPEPQTVEVGEVVEVRLYAVPDDGTEQTFTALVVAFTWDPTVLELREVDSGPHDWSFMFGFEWDEQLDGLNADCGKDVFCDPYTGLPFNDGNARFEAASFTRATATGDGLLIATFRFTALAPTAETYVVIEAELGEYSETRVLQLGGANVTGSLGRASIAIKPSLSVADLTMPAGRTAEIWVYGEISGHETFGVEILVEIVSRPENTGTVEYTPAPPVDVVQRGDPWRERGSFSPYDTDWLGFSATLNGSVDDDGDFVGLPLAYAGPLSAFPVTSSVYATGTWDIVLADSFWVGPATGLRHGTLRIVDLMDGNGDGAIDARDYSEFQVCFTGALEVVGQPAYSLAPELRCVAYDSDDDGDIDALDYAAFLGAMSGPAP